MKSKNTDVPTIPIVMRSGHHSEYCECRECMGNRPIPDAGIQTTCIEHAYGSTERLSFQIKVF